MLTICKYLRLAWGNFADVKCGRFANEQHIQTMTRGGRKQLRHTEPTRVQPPRKCRVTYQVAHAPFEFPKESAAADESPFPGNNRSSVAGQRRASKRKTAGKLDSSNTAPAVPPNYLFSKASRTIRRTKASRAQLPEENTEPKRTAAKIQSPTPLESSPHNVKGAKLSRHPARITKAVTVDPKISPNSLPSRLTRSSQMLSTGEKTNPEGSEKRKTPHKRAPQPNPAHRADKHGRKPHSFNGSLSFIDARQATVAFPTVQKSPNSSMPLSEETASKHQISHEFPSITNPSISLLTSSPPPSVPRPFVFQDPFNDPPPPIPEGHKLVHLVRHCRAWHKYYLYLKCKTDVRSLVPRGDEFLYQIHDPGLTPGGHKEARLFAERYPHLQAPQIILASQSRRCLQMALEINTYLSETRPDLGRIRIVAHPDLQEVSVRPCDTGSPLDVLRTEFPSIEFPDAVFPEIYPRSTEIKVQKWDTMFDDVPRLLAERAERIRKYIKNNLDENEIIVISHGSFLHFLINCWAGEPGNSRSLATQLQPGDAKPFILPGTSIPGLEFKRFVDYVGPDYPPEWRLEDYDDEVALRGIRDCGIFTIERVRNA